MNKVNVPKAMAAAVTERRKRRTGTVVQSLRAVAGSSELAILAPPAPNPKAVAANASFNLEPQIDHRTAMLNCLSLFLALRRYKLQSVYRFNQRHE